MEAATFDVNGWYRIAGDRPFDRSGALCDRMHSHLALLELLQDQKRFASRLNGHEYVVVAGSSDDVAADLGLRE